MQVIHKKVLELKNAQSLPIRDLSEVLSVAVQKNKLVLYYTVDAAVNHTSMVDIVIKGTGHEHPSSDIEGKTFMGSHMMDEDTYVWHVWLRVRI